MRNGSGESCRLREQLIQRPCDRRENGELEDLRETSFGGSGPWAWALLVQRRLGGQEGASLDSAWWGALRILIAIVRPVESFKGIQAGDMWSRLHVEYCDHSLDSLGTMSIATAEAREKSQ